MARTVKDARSGWGPPKDFRMVNLTELMAMSAKELSTCYATMRAEVLKLLEKYREVEWPRPVLPILMAFQERIGMIKTVHRYRELAEQVLK